MEWIYIVIGAAILAIYLLIYFMRVKRSRRVDEYVRELSKKPDSSQEGGPSIPGATRDMLQQDSKTGGEQH